MNNTNINKTTDYNKWIGVLEEAAKSREKGQKHQYIVVSGGREYSVIDPSKIHEQNPKLSLPQIVKISQEKFEELKNEFKEGNINAEVFAKLSNKISSNTKKLIEGREAKPNQFGLKLARGIARVTSFMNLFISSVPGVYGFSRLNQQDFQQASNDISKLNQQEKDFQQDIQRLKGNIRQIEKDTLNEVEKEEFQKKITTQIGQIPTIVEEIRKDPNLSDENRQNNLQMTMMKSYPKDNDEDPYVTQFKKDVKRGSVAFLRKDDYLKIEDERPHPFYPLGEVGDKVVEEGAEALKALFKPGTGDERWEKALQLAVSQISLLRVFSAPQGRFNNESATNDVRWKNPEDEISYTLKAEFSHNLPPFELEIIRDPKTNAIKEVKVKVEGTLDIVRKSDEFEPTSEIVAAKAITGKLTYSLTLDDNNHPVISDLHSSLETSVVLKREGSED